MTAQNTPTSAHKAHMILRHISEAEPGTLRAAVAEEALEFFSDDPRLMFSDLAYYGCQSGMISSLVYYADTYRFFDAFYDEIEDMRDAIQEEMGAPLIIQGDLKNALAWFAFEETAFRMAREDLGLDL